MKILYTQQEFDSAKALDKLKIECYSCKKIFYKNKNIIQLTLNNHVDMHGKSYSTSCRYCSKECQFTEKKKGEVINCKSCDSKFYKKKSEIKKCINSFCSRSCSVTYNNKHKTHGTRRSKLEIWLEEQLTILYPNLEIHYNKKDTINSELDFYIPSLKLAIELNGIFHYEPIFGKDKLSKIQNNDQRKFQACIENDIELLLIDASLLKYFKQKNTQKYLDIITEIIDSKSKTTIN